MPLTAWVQRREGFVICTPDLKLGSAIVAKARGQRHEQITVDDQFVNAKGKPMERTAGDDGASEIGARQGQELLQRDARAGMSKTP